MDFKDRLTEETEKLFECGFPAKYERFQTLLDDKLFAVETCEDVRKDVRASCEFVRNKQHEKKIDSINLGRGEVDAEDNEVYYTPIAQMSSRKRKRKDSDNDDSDEEVDETMMECNKHIEAIIEVLKPELREMIESCNVVKTWMQLQIPEIQDGNNFGVEVQEEILEEVRRVEGDAENFLKTLSLYHLTRAEIVSKYSKYPYVQDFIFALEEIDVKEFSTLRMMALELRNYCLCVVDLFQKNKEKIIKPRGRENANLLIY